jgi:membrane-associated PAP2 superfamily phosphatase
MPFGCMMAFMFVFAATLLFAVVQILRGAFA